MTGTIIVTTNLAGLYYNLVRMECSAGPRVEVADGVPLARGTTAIPVSLLGKYQFTFRDIDGLYGGGSYGDQVIITENSTATITKNLYDADGNDLAPSKPTNPPHIPDPATPDPESPASDKPDQISPEPTKPEPDDSILDLLIRLAKAVLRLFKRR